MEKLSYSDIRLQIRESKEGHDFIVDNMKAFRWNKEDRALNHPNNLYKDNVLSLCKEASIDMDNVTISRQYDAIFTKNFLENKPGYLIKGLKN